MTLLQIPYREGPKVAELSYTTNKFWYNDVVKMDLVASLYCYLLLCQQDVERGLVEGLSREVLFEADSKELICNIRQAIWTDFLKKMQVTLIYK
jgi:hypothetical protein